MSDPLDRRAFLRGALLATATGAIAGCRETSAGAAPEVAMPYVPGEPLPWRNWAGNQACRPAQRVAPETEDAMVALLASADGAAGPIRPVGAGHSFAGLVPSDGTLVAADALHGLVSVDPAQGIAEVWAGTRLHALGPLLEAEGLALPNMPDIDYQTVAGAISTSTHGTGRDLGSFSSLVEGLTIATPSGELIECDRETRPDVFHAARCSLGALGVITRVRLRCVPSFRLVQRIGFEPLDGVLDAWEQRRRSHRHFELLAFPHTSMAQVLVTDLQEGSVESTGTQSDDAESLRDAYRIFGAVPWVGDALYDAALRLAVGGTETVEAGPSWQVLTHDRIQRFREMEYTVPAEVGPDCMRAVLDAIRTRDIPVVYPVEMRDVRRDDAWLSMFHERDGCTISLHQFADEDHRPVFDALEPIFWRYDGRPHWGKLHSLDAPQLMERYPRWDDFARVRAILDPARRMANAHLRRVLGA